MLNSLCFARATKKPDKIQVLLTPILRQALLATITIVRRFAQYELSDYESWPQSQIYTSDILFWWFQLFLLDLRQTIFCFYNMDKPHAFPASIFASRKRPAKGKVKLTIMISLSFALVPWPNPNVAMIYYIEHVFFCQSVVTLRKLWRRIIFSLWGGAGELFKSFSAQSFVDLFFFRSGLWQCTSCYRLWCLAVATITKNFACFWSYRTWSLFCVLCHVASLLSTDFLVKRQEIWYNSK